MSAIAHWRLRDRYYRLVGNTCDNCRAPYFPPVYVCRKCDSRTLTDTEMPHEGVVRSFTLLHEVPSGFEGQEPLLIALVKLHNGVQVLGQIVDAPDGVRLGDAVRVVFRRIRVEGEAGQIHYGFKFAPIREAAR